MLEIGLIAKESGSHGLGRFYPHTGYLGLSPVTVQGTIVSRLPPLCRTLPIKQVTVSIRCVETRTTGSDVEAVLFEKSKLLWEPAGESEYEDLGDWTSPFKITLATDVAKHVKSTQWTKDLKITWKLEVSFEHKPIQYVGNRIVKTYALDIQNYYVPIQPPLSPPSPIRPSQGIAEVFVNEPHGSFGPGDQFDITVNVRPDDPSTIVKRAIVVLERNTQAVDYKSKGKSRPAPTSNSSWKRSFSPQHYSRLEDDDSQSQSPSPPLALTSKVLEITTDESMPATNGSYWMTLNGVIPKRGSKWAAGETGSTNLTITSFHLRMKLVLKSKKGSSKEITLPLMPITLVGTSTSERLEAQSIIQKDIEHPKASLPRRKHRSSRRGLYMQEGTVDISDPIISGGKVAKVSSGPTSGGMKRRKTKSMSDTIPIIINGGGITGGDNVKPILLPSDHQSPPSQSISFVFPSLPPSHPPATFDILPERQDIALPITTLIHPTSTTTTTYSRPIGSAPPSPPPTRKSSREDGDGKDQPLYSDYSILRQFQQSGRRISTTGSEEEELQPSRSKPRLVEENAASMSERTLSHSEYTFESSAFNNRYSLDGTRIRPSIKIQDFDKTLLEDSDTRQNSLNGKCRKQLPSLDALGLGLPNVPAYDKQMRPRTAPSHSVFPSFSADSDSSRPASRMGSLSGATGAGAGPGPSISSVSNEGRMIPPPLSGFTNLSNDSRSSFRPVTSAGFRSVKMRETEKVLIDDEDDRFAF